MDTALYQARRRALRVAVPDGIILLLGNNDAPRNYAANIYPFRQDSHFLYFVGAARAGLAALLLPEGFELLCGPAPDPDDVVWSGPGPTLAEVAADAGVGETRAMSDLVDILARAREEGVRVHFLPPYRADNRQFLADLLGLAPGEVAAAASPGLAKAVADLRNHKTDDEVLQIENALKVTGQMYLSALNMIQPGRGEAEVVAMMQGVALLSRRAQSFPPIVSVRGEVLHNETYDNTLAKGDLLLIDSGAESPLGYASDITRTFPVAGVFSQRQREIYDVVLMAQEAAIAKASEHATNLAVHLAAARTVAVGMKDLGLMKGDVEEAVAAGAHALFFPHGIGHMLGLDVHDMEDLGDVVGYDEGAKRSEQFGLNFLRLARRLEPGFVITVEPGVYFVQPLIDRWAAEKRHAEFIDYGKLEPYRGFGGVRIEDDVLITEDGARVLGDPILKNPEEIENVMLS